MTTGVTLKAVEKKFGPALAGMGDPDTTFSAVRYAAGKGKKFAGVPGVREDAVFHLHFPLPVDWKQLKTKKGIPDFISDLTSSGPQGEQGREQKVEIFRAAYRQKQQQLEEKERQLQEKERIRQAADFQAQRLRNLAGKHPIQFSIEGESFRGMATIKVGKPSKTGKPGKVAIQISL